MLQAFQQVAKDCPSKIALSDEKVALSFAELYDWSEAMAEWLQKCTHDRPLRVLSQLPGGGCFTALQLGCLGSGSTFIPVSDAVTLDEIRYYIALSKADIVVTTERTEALRQICGEEIGLVTMPEVLAATSPAVGLDGLANLNVPAFKGHEHPGWGDTAQIQMTSGSTGASKGILISEANLQANLDNNQDWLSQFAGQDMFCPMPQFHAMGGALVMEFLFQGTGVHLASDGLMADHLRRIAMNQIGVMAGPPSYFRMMAKLGALTPKTVPKVHTMILGSDACDQMLYLSLRNGMPDAKVSLRYGLSESVGTLARLDLTPDHGYDETGLVGGLVPNMEVQLKPDEELPGETEILTRGGTVAERMLQGTDGVETPLVDEEGFLHTGDLGRLNEDGHVVVTGRKSQFIKRNGFRISPLLIEETLRNHQMVADVVVVGLPDPLSGERVVALLEPPVGAAEEPVLETLHDLLKLRLAPYNVPQEFRFVRQLPRTPAGKPDRHYIRLNFSDFSPIK